jgi:hypothetical protein
VTVINYSAIEGKDFSTPRLRDAEKSRKRVPLTPSAIRNGCCAAE